MVVARNAYKRDFNLITSQQTPEVLDFNKIKDGAKTLQGNIEYVLNWDNEQENNRRVNRKMIRRAIDQNDAEELRMISNYFYNTSGIYSRLVRYMAYLFKYDYFITPIIYDNKISEDRVVKNWFQAAQLLDSSNLKKLFGEIALKVVRDGCYYGYRMETKTACYLQDLPVDYCRSRYNMNGNPTVEFNLKYFDDEFNDATYRVRVLKLFDKEIQKAYVAYKQGKLPKDFMGDDAGWFLLDPEKAVKFNLSSSDTPLFISVIPNIMDLDEAKEIDKEKMKQQLLRIIVQEMPLDKNGDSIFTTDDIAAMHQNAVQMLGKAIGVNVLTTLADVDSIDMSDKGNVSSVDQLDKVERSVYNEAGVSQMQFNTSTNLALEKSIANDEATMTDLLLQFEAYAESLLKPLNKSPKRLYYKVQLLPTTVYNYKELSDVYRQQTTIGFSKLLPAVALGQSQLTVMSTAYFENSILELGAIFIPPQMSSTMNGAEIAQEEGDEGGRPELADDEKTDKTIANQESG